MIHIYIFIFLLLLIFVVVFTFIFRKKCLNESLTSSINEEFQANRRNSYTNMEVPTDFGTVKDPSWKISKNINGKNIVIESKGRTVWEPNFGPIWSGKWIYYGTVDSYKATQDINRVKFLIIKIDQMGSGIVEDEYLGYKMNVINAGSNILTGIIPSGRYSGYRAKLELLESSLVYKDPSNPFPVKMRYFIEQGSTVLNLSSGNIYNMQGYSTKFVGDKLVLSNFMEASGIQTDTQLAFSSQTLQKINENIKEQTNIHPAIQAAKKYISITSLKLLYKATKNGWSEKTFHQLCDGKGPTITIATLQDGRFIGAYSPVSWGTANGQYINNSEAFLFDSDKQYTSAESGLNMYAIVSNSYYGPIFGGGHDFISLPHWSPTLLIANPHTYLNNNKGPLGANRNVGYSYTLKDLEVYSVTVKKLYMMLKVAGKNDVPSDCARGDYKCQAKDVCEKVTGESCIHQTYDCAYGSMGSWYPKGTPGGSTFNFAYGYDVLPNGYGNICSGDSTYMTKYGLAANNKAAGLGKWTRQ